MNRACRNVSLQLCDNQSTISKVWAMLWQPHSDMEYMGLGRSWLVKESVRSSEDWKNFRRLHWINYLQCFIFWRIPKPAVWGVRDDGCSTAYSWKAERASASLVCVEKKGSCVSRTTIIGLKKAMRKGEKYSWPFSSANITSSAVQMKDSIWLKLLTPVI